MLGRAVRGAAGAVRGATAGAARAARAGAARTVAGAGAGAITLGRIIIRGYATDIPKPPLTLSQEMTIEAYVNSSHGGTPKELHEKVLSQVAEILVPQKLGTKTLHRGDCVNPYLLNYIMEQKEAGKDAIIPLKDILSFSKNSEVADTFKKERKRGSHYNNRHPVRLELNLEKSKVSGLDISKINLEESEVIVGGQNKQYIVIHPDEIGKGTAWTITIIPEEDLTEAQREGMYCDAHSSMREASFEARAMYPK